MKLCLFANISPQITQIWVIFTHLKLWVGVARHKFSMCGRKLSNLDGFQYWTKMLNFMYVSKSLLEQTPSYLKYSKYRNITTKPQSQRTQNISITFVQRRPLVQYCTKCYTKVLCSLGYQYHDQPLKDKISLPSAITTLLLYCGNVKIFQPIDLNAFHGGKYSIKCLQSTIYICILTIFVCSIVCSYVTKVYLTLSGRGPTLHVRIWRL